MTDLRSAVKQSIRDLGTKYRHFRLDTFEGEDGDLFVEVKSLKHNGNGFGVVNVSRQVALGCIEATDDDVTVHITCMFRSNVSRLTVSPGLRELADDELQGRISQELRIS